MAETVGSSGPEQPDEQRPAEGAGSEGSSLLGGRQPEPVMPRHHDLMRLVNHDAVQGGRRGPQNDQLRVPPPPPGRGSRGSTRRILEITQLMVLVLLTTGTGLAVASQLALPGDALYPVKRTTEAVILRMNPGNDAELASQFLERRLEEARERPQYAPDLLSEVFEDLASVERGTTDRGELEEVTREAVELTRDALGGNLPENASEQAQEAFEEASRPGEENPSVSSPPGTEDGDAGEAPDPRESPAQDETTSGRDQGRGQGQGPDGNEGQPGAGPPGDQRPGGDGAGEGNGNAPPGDRGPADEATEDEATEDTEGQEAEETEGQEAEDTGTGATEGATEDDEVSGQETEGDDTTSDDTTSDDTTSDDTTSDDTTSDDTTSEDTTSEDADDD